MSKIDKQWSYLADIFAVKFCIQRDYLKKILPLLGNNPAEVAIKLNKMDLLDAVSLLLYPEKD